MTPQNIPRPQAHDPAFRRAVIISVLISLAYYLTAQIGFEFALQPGSISPLWMPNAVLLVGLLLTPTRWRWLVILAVLPAHFASELQSGVPTAMVLSWFVSNSAQALIGAICISYLVVDRLRFDRVRDLTVFILMGAFLAPFLSSFLDAGLVKLNGWSNSSYWELWRMRFLSNVLTTLTLVPVVIVWVNGGMTALRKAPLRRYVEAGLLTIGLLAVGLFVFNSQRGMADKTPSLLYWPLPFLLWATVRFGPRGASTSLFLVMFLAITGATRGAGPFVTGSAANNAISIQWFLIVVSIPLMALAAVIEERKRAETVARQNEERLTLALNAAQMGTWDWQIAENPSTQDGRGVFDIHEVGDTALEAFFKRVHPNDRPAVESAISLAINEGKPYEIEFRLLENGNTRWILSKGDVLHDEEGRPSRMLGIDLDLTERKIVEQEAAEINERNQAILRAIPDMMFLHSKDGVYLDYYARDPQMLLSPPEKFLGKTVNDIMPREFADDVMHCISRLNGKGVGPDNPQVLEYSLHINNEERHYEARLVAAGGDKALSIVRDVTEARRAVELARQSEEKLLQSNRQIRALAARLITAQESERRRISLLLHDDVSQNVAALALSISRLKRKLPTSSTEMLAELDQLGSQAYDLTTQIRRLSHQLHPEVLEHLGLVAALQSHVTEFGHEERIAIKFAADVGVEPIPLDVSVCIYRVALEALRNVARHSGAASASISVKKDAGSLVLEVSDSGRGFDVEKARRGSGIGLLSTEERIRLLHGSLDIRSDPQTGTVLLARVPLVR